MFLIIKLWQFKRAKNIPLLNRQLTRFGQKLSTIINIRQKWSKAQFSYKTRNDSLESTK